MPFTEATKDRIKRNGHYKCCICHRHGLSLDAHHIIPESENGPSTEENGAPLCPTCHAEWGANAEKRTALIHRRDHLYELCTRHEGLSPEQADRLMNLLEGTTALISGFQSFVTERTSMPVVINAPTATASAEAHVPSIDAHGKVNTGTAVVSGGTVTARVIDDNALAMAMGQMAEYEDEYFEGILPEKRTEIEILEALDVLFDQVWYNRHWNLCIEVEASNSQIKPEVWAIALKAAAKVEEKYKDEPEILGPWSDFEWGMLNGKLSALRWILGDEWDILDT